MTMRPGAVTAAAREIGTPLADPTTLICDIGDSDYLGPTTIELNEAHGTASISYPAYQLHDVGHTVERPWSAGPFAATFAPNTITFSGILRGAGAEDLEINRLTGSVVESWASPVGL